MIGFFCHGANIEKKFYKKYSSVITNTFKDPPYVPGFKVPPLESYLFTSITLTCLHQNLRSRQKMALASKQSSSQLMSAERSSFGFQTIHQCTTKLSLCTRRLLRNLRALTGFSCKVVLLATEMYCEPSLSVWVWPPGHIHHYLPLFHTKLIHNHYIL